MFYINLIFLKKIINHLRIIYILTWNDFHQHGFSLTDMPIFN